MKNKTVAAWLALAGGLLGLHRFYLFGARDLLGWALPLIAAIGIAGVLRARAFGLDDHWSWLLIPFLGFAVAGCTLTAIVYGLMAPEKWNARFNRTALPEEAAAQTGWLTVAAVVISLLVGATALMASLAFSFQRYFEYQVEEARKISE